MRRVEGRSLPCNHQAWYHGAVRETKEETTMTKQTLGQRIAEKRRGRGMTQEALAEQLSVTPQAVSKWENDASCPDVLQVDTQDGTHTELWVD